MTGSLRCIAVIGAGHIAGTVALAEQTENRPMPHTPCSSFRHRFTPVGVASRTSQRAFEKAGFRADRTFDDTPFGPHVLLVRRRHHRQEPA